MMTSNSHSQALLTEKEAAEYLTVAPNTLAVWRGTKRQGPPFVRLGRAIRYRAADLDQWMTDQTVTPKK